VSGVYFDPERKWYYPILNPNEETFTGKMKPQIQKLPLCEHSSFVADTFYTPYFETPWHFHIEYELVLIVKGKGKRIVGNHVSDYEEGNLTFLGPDVPHVFRKEENSAPGGSLVIHFQDDFLGSAFKAIPEMQKINLLFQKSRFGIDIKGETRAVIAARMQEVLSLKGMDRLTCLLSLFTILANSTEYELLSGPEVSSQCFQESDKLYRVFDYVMANFQEEISLEIMADITNMSYSGFCRYFKNRTKKNFTHFVNEIRIGHACKRLMESDISVSAICYESGFNNMTNFNEQFKKIVKCTPYQFKLQSKV
jgi:AraC-like DNA-binding protein